MEIHNGGANVPLPKDVQDALEGARNNITVLGAEGQRLSRLNSAMNKDIVSLNAQMVEMEKAEAALAARVSVATEEAEKAEARRSKALAEAIEAEDSLSASNRELEDARSVVKIARESVEAAALELEKAKTVFAAEKDAWESKKKNAVQSIRSATDAILETLETQ